MKISPETVEILTNFSRINNSLLINKGNEFYTRNESKSIFGVACVSEQFPEEMGIHDLQSMLQYFKMTGNAPDIEIQEDRVLIKGNGTKVDYKTADKDIIICQEVEPSVPEEPFVTLEMNQNILQTINTAKNVGITKADTVELSCEGLQHKVKIYNSENSATNIVTLDIEGNMDEPLDFSIKFKDDQFPMIMQDYTLKLYERNIGGSTAFFATYESENGVLKYITPAKAQAGCMVKKHG